MCQARMGVWVRTYLETSGLIHYLCSCSSKARQYSLRCCMGCITPKINSTPFFPEMAFQHNKCNSAEGKVDQILEDIFSIFSIVFGLTLNFLGRTETLNLLRKPRTVYCLWSHNGKVLLQHCKTVLYYTLRNKGSKRALPEGLRFCPEHLLLKNHIFKTGFFKGSL